MERASLCTPTITSLKNSTNNKNKLEMRKLKKVVQLF